MIFNLHKSYQKDGSKWWLEKRNTTFPDNNSDRQVVIAVSRVLLNDFENNVSHVDLYYDGNNNVFSRKLTVNRSIKEVTVESSSPASNVVSLEVFCNSLLTSYRNNSNQTTSFGYDSLQRIISKTYDRIGASLFSYHTVAGKKGLIATITDAAGNTKEFDYDTTTGRLITINNSLNQQTRYSYNNLGKVVHIWGSANYPISLTYDQYGQVLSMTTYRNAQIDFSGINFPVATGDTTTWTHDVSSGLIISQNDSENHNVQYTYTVDGKLASRTWARQIAGVPLVTTYTYDLAGYLKKIDYSDNTPDIVLTYNRNGKPITIVDAAGTRNFAYNDAFLLISEAINGIYNKTITRTYATTGMVGRELNLNIDTDINYTYCYDTYGRLNAINNINFARVENSNLLGGVVRPNQINTIWNYEAHRNLVSSCNNSIISTYAYVNDALSNHNSMSRSGNAFTTPDQISYSYNNRNEIIEAVSNVDSGYNFNFGYDPIGNRINTNLAGINYTYSANSLNQYGNINSLQPTYDADGNMLTYGEWQYDWDGENRMISASNGTTNLVFEYDYMGRRVSKKTYSGSALVAHIRFVYDGYKLLEELDALNNNVCLRKYTWMPQTLKFDVPLTLTIGNNVYYYHVDANKNVTEITDSSGNLMVHYEYSPFGQLVKSTGILAELNPFRFSSEYWDQETGLIYYNYRYYNPALGRWINHDPAGVNGGYNLYAMVNNNIVNQYDLLGLWSLETHEKLTRDAWNAADKCKDKCKDDKDDFMDDLEDGSIYPDVPLSWPQYFIPGWNLWAIPRDFYLLGSSHLGDRQFWHGMAGEGTTADDIQKQIADRLAEKVNEFRKNPCKNGDALGEAAHTLADTYCPSHTTRDDAGNISGYNDYDKQDGSEHKKADILPESDPAYQNALNALKDFFNDACEGCDKKNGSDYTGEGGPLHHGKGGATTGEDGGYGPKKLVAK